MIEGLEPALGRVGLFNAGALHPDEGGTVILLGAGPGFWPLLKAAPEFAGPDPVDSYSTRVVSGLAARFGAEAVFPFGGPPYAPFFTWALNCGHAWQSPVGMLVQSRAGLMISYRGALRFSARLDLPPPAESPCAACPAPCLTACPVNALGQADGYDVPACRSYLDTEAGRDCMEMGCRARRACPISARFGRDPAQSAHHMRYFHK